MGGQILQTCNTSSLTDGQTDTTSYITSISPLHGRYMALCLDYQRQIEQFP